MNDGDGLRDMIDDATVFVLRRSGVCGREVRHGRRVGKEHRHEHESMSIDIPGFWGRAFL